MLHCGCCRPVVLSLIQADDIKSTSQCHEYVWQGLFYSQFEHIIHFPKSHVASSLDGSQLFLMQSTLIQIQNAKSSLTWIFSWRFSMPLQWLLFHGFNQWAARTTSLPLLNLQISLDLWLIASKGLCNWPEDGIMME